MCHFLDIPIANEHVQQTATVVSDSLTKRPLPLVVAICRFSVNCSLRDVRNGVRVVAFLN